MTHTFLTDEKYIKVYRLLESNPIILYFILKVLIVKCSSIASCRISAYLVTFFFLQQSRGKKNEEKEFSLLQKTSSDTNMFTFA